MTDPAPVLRLDVAYTVDGFTLEVAFDAKPGLTAVIGHSGAGKTSLLDLIAGLRKPVRGRIELAGRTLYDSEAGIDVPARDRRVGFVFQDKRLFPHKTTLANLRYGYDRLPEKRRRHEPEEIVELLDLRPLLGRRPGEMSGGEQQRVALGRALLTSPDLLLLDEPLTGLHPEMRAQTAGLLRRVRDELNAPILYVTHRSEDLEGVATDVLRLERGRVVTTAS